MLLPANWRVTQERGFEGLKWSSQLGVKVNVVAQVARQPEIVFERFQLLRIGEMPYGPRLFLGGDKAQGVNLLAQKFDVGVVKEGLGRLDGNVIFEKDVEEDAKLLEQVSEGLGLADNVIHVGPGPGTHVSQNIICLTLDVGH